MTRDMFCVYTVSSNRLMTDLSCDECSNCNSNPIFMKPHFKKNCQRRSHRNQINYCSIMETSGRACKTVEGTNSGARNHKLHEKDAVKMGSGCFVDFKLLKR